MISASAAENLGSRSRGAGLQRAACSSLPPEVLRLAPEMLRLELHRPEVLRPEMHRPQAHRLQVNRLEVHRLEVLRP